MKKIIIILLIIITTCLYQTSIEPFSQDFYPHLYGSSVCPCLSCVKQSRITR